MRIIIDGNIASGKTTQLALFEQKKWKVRREPIDSWPLDEFYSDPSRWGFLFHMIILKSLQPIESDVPVIYERSLLSSRHVFWPLQTSTAFEHDTYCSFYKDYMWIPDFYIYLDKSPETAYEHIQHRGQAGDFGVSLDLLKTIDCKYKELCRNIECHVIDANQSIEAIHSDICLLLFQHGVHCDDTQRNTL